MISHCGYLPDSEDLQNHVVPLYQDQRKTPRILSIVKKERKRRLSKDCEFLSKTEDAFIYTGMLRLMLHKLAKTG
jgi:hypothetical protein